MYSAHVATRIYTRMIEKCRTLPMALLQKTVGTIRTVETEKKLSSPIFFSASWTQATGSLTTTGQLTGFSVVAESVAETLNAAAGIFMVPAGNC